MIRPAWLFLGGMLLVVACSAPSSKPSLQVAQAESRNPFDLMKQQCRGIIHNCVCSDDRGPTVLAEDGQLRPPVAGGWQPTMCGIPVFFPDKDHPHP